MIKPSSVRRVVLVAVLASLTCSLLPVWAEDAAKTDEWKAPARAARKKNPVASDEKSIAAGKATYVKECQSCHGSAGKGDGTAAKDLEKKPGDLSKSTMWDETDGALFWKITDGRKPMPSFEKTLTEDQRWQAINYIRTLAPKPATSQPDKKGGAQ